jgi:hypothetical protein
MSDLLHNNVVEGSRPTVTGGQNSATSVNPAITVSWVEYDYNASSLWQDTTWPDIHSVPFVGICDGGCAQGDLWKRLNEDGEDVSAESMIMALETKRQQIAMYQLLWDGHQLVEQATPFGADLFSDWMGMMGMGMDDDDYYSYYYDHSHSQG